MRMRRISVVAVAVALSLLCVANTFAQTTNATLGGTITDATGALIPGAEITATNSGTGIVTTVVSNETGAYQFASLQTGTYDVTASLPGFQTQTYTEVALGVAQQVRLNFSLQVGTVATAVEVSVGADTLIATTSASVGTVLPEYKVTDLPLATRNALQLVSTTGGVQERSFAGARLGTANITRDGVSTGDGRYANSMGISATTYLSPDLIEEVRVIVAPADAELGRGSGQVQMVTRSGTNEFHGSLFYGNRNSALDANSWINNFNGVDKDYRNGTQFAGRIAGPIVRNKTFFFFLYDGQRYVSKSQFTGNVLTAEARQGNFRYFPGVQNGNIFANTPTVDASGNPVAPAGMTLDDLQTVSVFGVDPSRPGMDPSGWVQRLFTFMPPPNDFTIGDGLNTAGHRWLRRLEGEDIANGDGQNTNRNQYNVRIDHNFNQSHKATFSATKERNWSVTTQTGISNWPGGFDGSVERKPEFYAASLVSTLSPTVVNEFRFGHKKSWHYGKGSVFRTDAVGDEARSQLLNLNGQNVFPDHILFPGNIFTNLSGRGTRGQTSPLFSFSDTLSWTRGEHAFKAGFEVRYTSSDGFNGTENPEFILPNVDIGTTPGFGVTGLQGIPGLTGNNLGTAEDLLLDLSGSVRAVSQGFNLSKATDTSFQLVSRRRDFHQNEWGAFFKDDWKIAPNLTLNLGFRYDYYGVPYESGGLMTAPVGGEAALFGISGTGFDALWKPGDMNGSLTRVQFAGKHSPNPDRQVYNDDWNNFAPAIGFSWSLPWWGQDKTVVRAGYGINYSGAANFNSGLNLFAARDPGSSASSSLVTLGLENNFYNLTNIPVPLPPSPDSEILYLTTLERRSGSMNGYVDDRVTPYIQNWNLEIQRELAPNLTFEARYIGSKGTKLWGRIPLNTANIFESGILEAFDITRAGGDASLFDRMLAGLNYSGNVVGTDISTDPNVTDIWTGSEAFRASPRFRSYLANGDVGQFAFRLADESYQGVRGGLFLNNGFDQNLIKVNPQFTNVTLDGNPGNSTYHSMQLQVTKRLSNGFTNQTTYTWSRTLGDNSSDGGFASSSSGNHWFNPRDRSLNKALVAFHRTQDLRSNGTFELPFGPGRQFGGNSTGTLARLLEQWQFGAVFSWTSGAPLSIAASTSTITQAANNTPVLLGDFPKSTGEITPDSAGGTYFPGFQVARDPGTGVTGEQGLQSRVSNRMIVDGSGNPVLVNPAPGQLGTLGLRWIEGPSHVTLDMNLIKRIQIDETKQLELRADVKNIMNNPWWTNPNTQINSTSFGRITGSGVSSGTDAGNRNGTRTFTLNARLNF